MTPPRGTAVTLPDIGLTTDQQLLASMRELRDALTETNDLLIKTRSQVGDLAHVCYALLNRIKHLEMVHGPGTPST